MPFSRQLARVERNRHDPLQQLPEVHGLHPHPVLTGKIEKPADDLLAPVGLFDQEVEVVGEVVPFLELSLQEAGIKQDGSQGVIQLVGHARGQLPHGGELLGVDQVAVHQPDLRSRGS